MLILQVSDAGCCVVNDEAWICGGVTLDRITAAVYSWRGPGNKWIERPSLPGGMMDHKAVYDGDKAIWVLTGWQDANVYKYQLGAASWMRTEPLPQWSSNSGCVRHGQHIFSLGGSILGEWRTTTILVTNTNIGNTFTADIKLPHAAMKHCVAII